MWIEGGKMQVGGTDAIYCEISFTALSNYSPVGVMRSVGS